MFKTKSSVPRKANEKVKNIKCRPTFKKIVALFLKTQRLIIRTCKNYLKFSIENLIRFLDCVPRFKTKNSFSINFQGKVWESPQEIWRREIKLCLQGRRLSCLNLLEVNTTSYTKEINWLDEWWIREKGLTHFLYEKEERWGRKLDLSGINYQLVNSLTSDRIKFSLPKNLVSCRIKLKQVFRFLALT